MSTTTTPRKTETAAPAHGKRGVGVIAAAAFLIGGLSGGTLAAAGMSADPPADPSLAAPVEEEAVGPETWVALGTMENGVLEAGRERGYDDARGIGVLVGATGTKGEASTDVGISVHGLRPDTTYPAHLHAESCATSGGGHYMDDVNGVGEPPNELWLTVETDANGGAVAFAATENWRVREAPRSVVIHDPEDKAKLVCIDLSGLGSA